jgi:branched-chain amino acid transport system substrate-binding protein
VNSTRHRIAGLCVIVSCLTACAGKDDSVSIGHAGPLTGGLAHLGKDNEQGVALALEEANAAGVTIGGRKVTFVLMSEDDEAKPEKGTVVAQKLADARVAGVIGHLNSGTTIPASKIYSEAGIPQISPSATNVAYTNQGYKTAFRMVANDAQQGKVLGDYAVKTLAAKKIAVIDDGSAYGKGLANEFESSARAAGAEFLPREFTDTTKVDFAAILTNIKARNPDLIFFGGMDSQSGLMQRQIRNLGIKARFMSGSGSKTGKFIELAGADGEGAFASQPGVPIDKMPQGLAFAEKYRARFKTEIQLYAPYAYDAANAMLAAMKQADSTDPKKYLPVLAAISYDGVAGKVRFDEKGDIKGGSISVYTVSGGKWMPLETVGN